MWPSLFALMAKTLVDILVISCLDYCNLILTGQLLSYLSFCHVHMYCLRLHPKGAGQPQRVGVGHGLVFPFCQVIEKTVEDFMLMRSLNSSCTLSPGPGPHLHHQSQDSPEVPEPPSTWAQLFRLPRVPVTSVSTSLGLALCQLAWRPVVKPFNSYGLPPKLQLLLIV